MTTRRTAKSRNPCTIGGHPQKGRRRTNVWSLSSPSSSHPRTGPFSHTSSTGCRGSSASFAEPADPPAPTVAFIVQKPDSDGRGWTEVSTGRGTDQLRTFLWRMGCDRRVARDCTAILVLFFIFFNDRKRYGKIFRAVPVA